MRLVWLVLAIVILGCGNEKKHPMPAPTASGTVAAVPSGATAPSASAAPSKDDRDWIAISRVRKDAEWPAAGRYERFVEVEGAKRRYLFQIPATKREGKKAPLLIMLHGARGKPEQYMREGLGISLMAARMGWLAVFPQGGVEDDNGFRWNHGLCTEPNDIDEVAFIRTLIDTVSKDIEIDPRRIYVMGFSSGGKMAQVLGAELGDSLAAIAPIASYAICTPDGGKEQRIEPKTPINVLMLFGGKDPNVPLAGGPTEKSGGKLTIGSAEDVTKIWTELNKCGEGERKGAQADPAVTIDFECKETKKRVLTVINRRAGHQIPERVGRKPTMDLVARFLEASFLPRKKKK